MGKLLLFDAFNGVSGDMILGALVDLGLPMEYLETRLASLKLGGFRCTAQRIKRSSIQGTDFRVALETHPSHSSKSGGHHHDHSHGHSDSHDSDGHRSYTQIRERILQADLEESVKQRSVSIFHRLAKVHGASIEEVHFHEVGAVDSIVDIVGACIGFEYFGVQEFFAMPLNLGGGSVTFSHGTWPVPAPATAELVQGFQVRLTGVEAELTTPTGAAIVTTLVLGESAEAGHVSRPSGLVTETVVLLEANIDDMDPEMFGYFMQTALDGGALDVFFVPAQMKKNRPGQLVTVLCRPEDRDGMLDLLFRETTTLGVRISTVERSALEREIREIDSEFGPVRCKLSRRQGEIVDVSPEFEDLKRIARQSGLPLKVIRRKLFERLTELKIWEKSSI